MSSEEGGGRPPVTFTSIAAQKGKVRSAETTLRSRHFDSILRAVLKTAAVLADDPAAIWGAAATANERRRGRRGCMGFIDCFFDRPAVGRGGVGKI